MREQYISHQTLKSDAPMAKLKQCSCCPYGYHIDLDFVNYCEKLAANARPQSDEQRLRREKRRQRKSMEVMLGVGEQLLQNYHNHQQHQQQARINCIPVVVEVGIISTFRLFLCIHNTLTGYKCLCALCMWRECHHANFADTPVLAYITVHQLFHSIQL